MKRNATPYDLLDFEQGSEAWKQFRFDHATASQIAAMVGLCPYQKREALLQEKLTRTEREVSGFMKGLFERGHEAEALGREWVKENLGYTFQPVVLQSRKTPELIASLDGFIPDKSLVFEAKYSKAEKSVDAVELGIIKPHHMFQVQAQLYVSGAERALYYIICESRKAAVMWVYPDAFYQKMIPVIVAEFMADIKRLKGVSANG